MAESAAVSDITGGEARALSNCSLASVPLRRDNSELIFAAGPCGPVKVISLRVPPYDLPSSRPPSSLHGVELAGPRGNKREEVGGLDSAV